VLLLVIAGGIAAYRWISTREESRYQRLPDGTQLWYRSATQVLLAADFPNHRAISLDGQAYLDVPRNAVPLHIRTRLLSIEVWGPAHVLVTARSHERGEQIEVLDGRAIARKAYSSPYPEPDDLGPGEMSMVNQDIDLMEKERAEVAVLKREIARLKGTRE